MTVPDPTAPAEDVPPVADPVPAEPTPAEDVPVEDVPVAPETTTGQNTPVEVVNDPPTVVEDNLQDEATRVVPDLGAASGNPTSPDVELTPEAAAVLEGMDTIKRVEY